MTVLQIIPVALSLLVLGAHFLRAGQMSFLIAIGVLLALLPVRKPWAARLVQIALLLGALEWLRTLVLLAQWRMQAGQPALRLAIILGSVAVITGLSALLFQTRRLGRFYGLRPGHASPPTD